MTMKLERHLFLILLKSTIAHQENLKQVSGLYFSLQYFYFNILILIFTNVVLKQVDFVTSTH